LEAEKGPAGLISACLILVAWICGNPLRAQETKLKHRMFIGAGIGISNVAFSQLDKTVNGFGPSFDALLGVNLSDKISLQLEYVMNHPNDEEPKTTDIIVTKKITNGIEIMGTEIVRVPKVLQTNHLLISFRKSLLNHIYYRLSAGLGWHLGASYYIQEKVISAGIESEIGYALGLVGGYERYVSDRLSLAIEASVRWSSGEDSTSARFVFGLGTVVKWDF